MEVQSDVALLVILRYCLLTRSGDMFANISSEKVHPMHRLTRGDVAFSGGTRQLEFVHWREADKVGSFWGHKGDQE